MGVEHVVLLCLENRSFDHLLGFLEHPDPTFEGLRRDGPHTNPGADGVAVAATPDAKRVLPFGPDHSHDAVLQQLATAGPPWKRRPTNTGFVASYELQAAGRGPSTRGGLLARLLGTRVLGAWLRRKKSEAPHAGGLGPLVMLCQGAAHVPVLSRLALEFAVCDHWFCSVPGETWPNRNFLHAATSDGETDIAVRPYTNRTIFELLEDNGSDWRIYHDDVPQIWAFPHLWDTPARHAKWFPMTDFAAHVARGDLPEYTFIEPDHRPHVHELDRIPALGGAPDVSNSQHPDNNVVSVAGYESFEDTVDTDFARGERLIAAVYEALRANAELFETTVLVITYDEHGGFYDHVPPTQPVVDPDTGHRRGLIARVQHALWRENATSFDFTSLGVRVPTLVISPFVDRQTVEHGVLEHASVPATLRALFAPAAAPLTARDAHAATFGHLWSRTSPRTDLPDLSGFLAPPAAAAPDPPASAAPAAAAPDPPASAAPAAAAQAASAPARPIPDYYQEFLAQGQLVRQHLREIAEPEAAAVVGGSSAAAGAAVATAFDDAARRHRGEAAEPAA